MFNQYFCAINIKLFSSQVYFTQNMVINDWTRSLPPLYKCSVNYKLTPHICGDWILLTIFRRTFATPSTFKLAMHTCGAVSHIIQYLMCLSIMACHSNQSIGMYVRHLVSGLAMSQNSWYSMYLTGLYSWSVVSITNLCPVFVLYS